MESKEYLKELILRRVYYYNDCWGDTFPDSEFINNTKETVDTLLTYCELLKNKKNVVNHDFEANPTDVKMLVNEIIRLVCGDMHFVRSSEEAERLIKETGKDQGYHCHAVKDSGLIRIEYEPVVIAEILVTELNKLKEALQSDERSVDSKKYEGKFYEFEGYEDGSEVIYISEINFKRDRFVFTGATFKFCTVNNQGDGILINDVEDWDFGDVLRCDECFTADDIKENLEGRETTLKSIISDVEELINGYWIEEKDFYYDYCKRKKAGESDDEDEEE